MIYLDSSVVLAQLFAEDRQPPEDLWREPLTASRLLQYEVWTRVHAHRFEVPHGEQVRDLLDGVAYIELTPPVLARALSPSPSPFGRWTRCTWPPWTCSGATGSRSSWPAMTRAF